MKVYHDSENYATEKAALARKLVRVHNHFAQQGHNVTVRFITFDGVLQAHVSIQGTQARVMVSALDASLEARRIVAILDSILDSGGEGVL